MRDLRIEMALRDSSNGSRAACYARKTKTGTPFKTNDKRVKHWIDNKPAVLVALENGISRRTFAQRIERGWTAEQAVKVGRTRYDKDPRKNISISCVVDGVAQVCTSDDRDSE